MSLYISGNSECVIVIRNAAVYETVTYQKTDHPVYDAIIVRDSEGADIEAKEVPSYGEKYVKHTHIVYL